MPLTSRPIVFTALASPSRVRFQRLQTLSLDGALWVIGAANSTLRIRNLGPLSRIRSQVRPSGDKTMPVTAEIHEALDLSKLKLPASPRVVSLEVEEYEDADGEPALRVLAVIDESTVINRESARGVSELNLAIIDSLRQHGVTLFPYVFIAKPRSLSEYSVFLPLVVASLLTTIQPLVDFVNTWTDS